VAGIEDEYEIHGVGDLEFLQARLAWNADWLASSRVRRDPDPARRRVSGSMHGKRTFRS
jgi:hypothetical protein